MANLCLVLLSVVFGMLRFLMPNHALSLPGTYEAFAHLFLGGLLGAWLESRKYIYLVLVAILTGVELVAFFTKG